MKTLVLTFAMVLWAGMASAATDPNWERLADLNEIVTRAVARAPKQVGLDVPDEMIRLQQMREAVARVENDLKPEYQSAKEAWEILQANLKALKDQVRDIDLAEKAFAALKQAETQIQTKKILTGDELATMTHAIDAFASKSQVIWKPVVSTYKERAERVVNGNDELIEAEKRADISVVARIPELTSDDSFALDKVRLAFEKATPDMFFQVAGRTGDVFFRYEPQKDHRDERAGGYTPPARGEPQFTSSWQNGPSGAEWVIIEKIGDLPKGTPFLQWEKVDEGTIIAVTPDGGRYRATRFCTNCGVDSLDPVSTAMPGIGAPNTWPAPVPHFALTGKDVEQLEAVGALKAGSSKSLEGARKAALECVQNVQAIGAMGLQSIREEKLSEADRTKQLALYEKEIVKQIALNCGLQKRRFEAVLTSIVNQRKADRAALHRALLPRLKAVASQK